MGDVLGNKLKELRKEKKITQDELAKLMNVHKGSISNWENGYRFPEEKILLKLAELYDCSIDYLLGRTDIRNPIVVKKSQVSYDVTKRDIKQYENFVEGAETFFMNDEIDEDDKEKLFRDISELFWKAKLINKEKYGKKNKKGD